MCEIVVGGVLIIRYSLQHQSMRDNSRQQGLLNLTKFSEHPSILKLRT